METWRIRARSDAAHRAHAHPLLIINADDLGLRAQTTDAIVRCFGAGGITSASAMVWMPDSRRASELAREMSLPVGLHLNLTHPFAEGAVPRSTRRRHEILVRWFSSRARWAFNPVLHRLAKDVVLEQLHEFESLYGEPPSHIDGHHHVQFTPNLLLGALPEGTKLRRGETFTNGEKPLMNRLVRHPLDAIITGRFPSPRYVFSIRTLHPELGGVAMERKLELARHMPVEVMCHPSLPDERAILESADWNERIMKLPTGSYRDL